MQGLDRLRVYHFRQGILDTSSPQTVDFPEPAYSAGLHVNREFDATGFRYSYQSLVSPASVFFYNSSTSASTLLKQQEVPGDFDRELYASERLWITAEDGVRVPVSLVYKRDTFHKDGTNPLYVYGYGSYGYPPAASAFQRLTPCAARPRCRRTLTPTFAAAASSETAWHDAGKMMAKTQHLH